MKTEIHPEYGKTTVRCACGNSFETSSTIRETMQVDICSACHPFFTGKAKILDTAGRIDRFKKKFGDKVALGRFKKPKKAPVRVDATEDVVKKDAEKKA